MAGTDLLLHVGNGGVFEDDTTQVERIVAVDVFIDRLPSSNFPPNVTARRGDALVLDEPDDAYEMVLEALLYHHLVGARARDSTAIFSASDRRGREGAPALGPPGGRGILRAAVVLPIRAACRQTARAHGANPPPGRVSSRAPDPVRAPAGPGR